MFNTTSKNDKPYEDNHGYWSRVFFTLPPALNRIKISVTRSKKAGTLSGAILDDIRIWSCDEFSKIQFHN